MSIWAHSMVKNEARWLWYAVSSVINRVDKILLWDTGSTDGTLEICAEIAKTYGNKIDFRKRNLSTVFDFTQVRQEMLEETRSEWFLMLDGDEIWWKDSIKKVTDTIHANGNRIESIFVPTINTIGDIFHYQDESSGRYHIGNKIGHYNLRAINRSIPGLHSQGRHGVWGWADENNKMIQDRSADQVAFVDAPYLHTTFIQRASKSAFDRQVVKRSKKLKYEIGNNFPPDFYYPESLFDTRPGTIESPWTAMELNFRIRATIETPFRKLKRRLFKGGAGY